MLITAASKQHVAVAEWLLTHGARVNAADRNGLTALLHVARKHGNAEMTEVLLANGADVNRCDVNGTAALEIAAVDGHMRFTELLLAAGADYRHTDHNGDTCLHVAAHFAHTALVQLLLQHGAAAVMNRRGCWCPCCGSGPVLISCRDTATLKLVLAAGADIHCTTNTGNTCLHVAAVHGYPAPVLCILIKAGADLHAVNHMGKTAADVAAVCGFKLVEALLLRAARNKYNKPQQIV
jgi:uncharacterized protein